MVCYRLYIYLLHDGNVQIYIFDFYLISQLTTYNIQGLAYALPDGNVFIHNKWKSKKFGAITKPKTQILLNESGKCVAFGIDASDVYSQLDTETQQKWLLFERFKMSLYDHDQKENDPNPVDEAPPIAYDDQYDADEEDQKAQTPTMTPIPNAQQQHRIGIKKELIAMNGKSFPSERVFVEALKFLKSEAQKYFKKLKIGKLKDHEIQWILTVPAIWNDFAKNQMREWAISADLVSRDVDNQLKV